MLAMINYISKKRAIQEVTPLLMAIKASLLRKFGNITPSDKILIMHILGFNARIDCPNIEIHATHRCNLNCAHCSHFTPLAAHHPDVDIDRMIADIEKLGSIKNADRYIMQVDLLGGEPLLCDRLEELMDAIDKNLDKKQHTVKFLISNGILLKQKHFDMCRKYHFSRPMVTLYPTVTIDKSLTAETFHDGSTFDTMPKAIEPKFPSSGKYSCPNGKCMQLLDGAIHLCSVAAYSCFPEEHFGIKLPKSKFDSIRLDDIESYNEVILFNYLQHPFCRHCDMKSNRPTPWSRADLKNAGSWFTDADTKLSPCGSTADQEK